jgi:hypothetical protein
LWIISETLKELKTGTIITIEVFGKRGPPAKYFMENNLSAAAESVACG